MSRDTVSGNAFDRWNVSNQAAFDPDRNPVDRASRFLLGSATGGALPAVVDLLAEQKTPETPANPRPELVPAITDDWTREDNPGSVLQRSRGVGPDSTVPQTTPSAADAGSVLQRTHRPTSQPSASNANSEEDLGQFLLGSAGANATVRELTWDEWNALTPVQQRAVEGNYEMYMSRNDEERQAELFQLLGYGEELLGKVQNFATYDDILSLNDTALAQRGSPVPGAPLNAQDHLINLANAVYGTTGATSPLTDGEFQPGSLTTRSSAITEAGLGDFSSLSLPDDQASWVDENILPYLRDDNWVEQMGYDQEGLDTFYAALNENLPGATRAQVANYLRRAAAANNIDLIDDRLNWIGFQGR